MNTEKINNAASIIVNQVNKMHVGKRTWNKACGQWLVYGFERYFGFGGAVDLQARVQRAWEAGADLNKTVVDFLTEEIGETKS